MVTIILMAIIMMSMVGTIMYTMMTTMDQMQSLISAQTEKQTLDIAEAVVINRLKPIGENQQLVAEIGSYGDNHQEIPASWGIKNVNTHGNKLIYCPIGAPISGPLNGLGNENVKLNTSTDYPVRYKNYFNGEKYVVQSGFELNETYSNKGVIAFVISPQSSSGISCGSVILENSGEYEKYIVNPQHGKGRVAAITKSSVISYRANQPITVKSSENSNAALKDLTDYWQSIHPLRFSVIIDTDNTVHIGENNILMSNQFPGANQEIMIKGIDNSVANINASSARTITFENVSVVIENINFIGPLRINFINSEITVKNVTFNGEIFAENSNLNLTNTNINGGAYILNSALTSYGNVAFSKDENLSWMSLQNPLQLSGTRFNIKGDTSVSVSNLNAAALFANNSEITISESQVSVATINSNANGIALNRGSSLIANTSTVNLTTSGSTNSQMITVDELSKIAIHNTRLNSRGSPYSLLSANGDIQLSSSEISTNNQIPKIIMIGGTSSLTMDGNTEIGIGSGAQIGVSVENGNVVNGGSAKVNASVCWSGLPFANSGNQSTGSSFKNNPDDTQDDFFITINRSNWTCN